MNKEDICWQLVYDVVVNDRTYYLKEFYTGKTKKIPQKYFTQIDKLVKDKVRYNVKICNCEMALQNIIKKVLKRKNK